MMRALGLLAALLATPVLAAGPYDGLYRPDQPWAEGWDCRSVGSDGGALAIMDGAFFGVESRCDLTAPVQVRGMNATLYDAVCAGEGETWSYRVMIMTTETGVVIVRDGFANPLRRCE